jgi:centrosomal protein CEP164
VLPEKPEQKPASESEESNSECSSTSSSSSSEVDSNCGVNVANFKDVAVKPSDVHFGDVLEKERLFYKLRLDEALEELRRTEDAKLESELDVERLRYDALLTDQKKALEDKFKNDSNEISENYRIKLEETKAELIENNKRQFEIYKESLLEDFNAKVKEISDEHKSTMTTLQRNYDEIVEELDRDLKTQEELTKKEHATNLTEMRIKMSHELDMERQRMRETGEDRLYEKIRCEKRLLEDKYKCLKEKYMRLKNDVRISLERRKKRREQQDQHPQSVVSNNSYGTDERSNTNTKMSTLQNYEDKLINNTSNYIISSVSRRPTHPKIIQVNEKAKLLQMHEKRKPFLLNNNHYNDDTSQSETTHSKNYFQFLFAKENNESTDSDVFERHHDKSIPMSRQKRKIFSKTKSASTSKLNSSKYEREHVDCHSCQPGE